jgi:enamine deaminase RidA (YjgF/YER057c/UK114 family)
MIRRLAAIQSLLQIWLAKLVQIYLTSLKHKPAVDEIYKQFFVEPYPVRACVAVSELPTPGTIIEVVATTALPN